MTKINWLLLCIALIVPCSASAQSSDRLFTVRQESIPPSDSGGRWLHTAMVLTSVSAYPQHVQLYTFGTYIDYSVSKLDSVYKLADSAYYMADSIFIYWTPWVRSSTPWKYIDSSYPYAQEQLDFLLPAHGTLRIPINIAAITRSGPAGDTISRPMQIISSSDSSGKTRSYLDNDSVRCIGQFSGILGAWQESVPANDSGGRWLASTVDVQSVAPFATRIYIRLNDLNDHSSPNYQDTFWKLADTALYMADSIYVTNNTYYHYTSGTPSKYLDTIHSKTSDGFDAYLTFVLPAHVTLHIPFFVRANGESSYLSSLSFGVGYYDRDLAWNPYYINVSCPYACSRPFVQYNGQPVSNKDAPTVIGQAPSEIKGSCLNCSFVENTVATYKVIGEYANQFIFPDTLFDPSNNYPNTLQFKGAPKSPIYDTLIANYTNCWGTITTTTPITAYSTYPDGYHISKIADNFVAPFLGRTDVKTAVVVNTSDFPIALRNLRATGYDSMDFEVSAPAMIAAHDSAYITVTLIDRNVYLDTLYPDRSASITGVIAPYQQELNFQDSTFTFSVSGTIDVYSPKYFASPPELKHGIHPRGIIFTSSVSSLVGGPHTFLTVYGNNDSTTEYFGMPYYDDPRFTLTVGQYIGPAVTLPGYVDPDTGLFSPGIEVLTTFSGDSYHNYRTQLHWPRAVDTVTIDVLALGSDAASFECVKPVAPPSSTISIWPNPASQLLHIRTSEQNPIWISDALGRIVLKKDLSAGYSDIDISNLPLGIYDIFLPKHRQAVKLQIFR